MIANRDVDAAWKYHNATKHSYLSLRAHPHFLDWENKPLPFKIYPTLEVMRLSKDFKPTSVPALSAVATTVMPSTGDVIPDLGTLAQLLFFSAGVTKSKKYPGGEMFFRAAACTGALYEIELYVVCSDLPGLEAGVYHFGVAEFGLRQLRRGDYRQVLVDATAHEPSIAHAPVIIVCTGTYWRNAWKYRSRTYRHFGWDNGTILANLLAVSSARDLPAKVICGFADGEVTKLVGVETRREVAFSLVSIGSVPSSPPALAKVEPLELPVVAYSKTEADYPAMRQMHEASSLLSAEEVRAWRAETPRGRAAIKKSGGIVLQPVSEAEMPHDTIEEVILRRGSTRKFSQDALTFTQLSTMLDRATSELSADFLNDPRIQLNDLYLVVNGVEGMASGAYFYDRQTRALQLLKVGDFRRDAGYLGLEQQLPADASVDIFFLADLHRILERFGNRGYRAVQLEAGILGGRLYLSAYAQRLGATGLTFYDDSVVSFFSPHAKGKSAIFLVALGKSGVAKADG